MRLRKTWLLLLVVGLGILVSWTLVGIPVGFLQRQNAKTLSNVAVELSRGRAASPIEDYRKARYQNAIRGLTYESGFVEVASDWQQVLEEAWAGENVDALLERGAGQLQKNMVIDALQTYTLAVLVDPEIPGAYQGLAGAFIAKGKTG